MFCPKCGIQNPEDGKFCRSCGSDLGNVAEALSGTLAPQPLIDRKGKPISMETAIVKLFTGFAFLIVTIALAFSQTGRGWWFWMLIPTFSILGTGVAQLLKIRSQRNITAVSSSAGPNRLDAGSGAVLPPQPAFVAPRSKYQTGDLVPPSVTDGTTRHLKIDTEGETMALPPNKNKA